MQIGTHTCTKQCYYNIVHLTAIFTTPKKSGACNTARKNKKQTHNTKRPNSSSSVVAPSAKYYLGQQQRFTLIWYGKNAHQARHRKGRVLLFKPRAQAPSMKRTTTASTISPQKNGEQRGASTNIIIHIRYPSVPTPTSAAIQRHQDGSIGTAGTFVPLILPAIISLQKRWPT